MTEREDGPDATSGPAAAPWWALGFMFATCTAGAIGLHQWGRDTTAVAVTGHLLGAMSVAILTYGIMKSTAVWQNERAQVQGSGAVFMIVFVALVGTLAMEDPRRDVVGALLTDGFPVDVAHVALLSGEAANLVDSVSPTRQGRFRFTSVRGVGTHLQLAIELPPGVRFTQEVPYSPRRLHRVEVPGVAAAHALMAGADSAADPHRTALEDRIRVLEEELEAALAPAEVAVASGSDPEPAAEPAPGTQPTPGTQPAPGTQPPGGQSAVTPSLDFTRPMLSTALLPRFRQVEHEVHYTARATTSEFRAEDGWRVEEVLNVDTRGGPGLQMEVARDRRSVRISVPANPAMSSSLRIVRRPQPAVVSIQLRWVGSD